MGVAMIVVGATYEDDVSTYLIVGGIFVIILYLLPMLSVLAYIKETINGENFWSKYSHLFNKRGAWNKRGGGAKVAKSLNVEPGINVEGRIFWKKLLHKSNKRGGEGGKI